MIRFPVSNSHRLIAAAFALLAIQYSTVVQADPEDPFNILLSTGMRYEDNLFRVSDGGGSAVLGNASKHDMVYTATAGIKIDKPYAQQRFIIDAAVTENKYQHNDFLDWTGFDYRAAWLWHLTPRISGTLEATQSETLNNFGDFRIAGRNSNSLRSIQTNERREFTADVLLWGGWHVVGGVSEIESRNSETFNEVGDYKQDSAELGGRYVFPSGTEITLVQRESTGDYEGRSLDLFNRLNQFDTGFDQSQTEAKLDWYITGKSRITAKLGYVDREHDNFSQRDYDGETGLLAWRWTPTGKLLVNVAVSRNLYSFQEGENSYYVADTFTFSPLWAITDKTSLEFRYDYSDRDYLGDIGNPDPNRNDIVQSMMLTAEWQALRTLLVSGVIQREVRASSRAGYDYEADSVGITAELLF